MMQKDQQKNQKKRLMNSLKEVGKNKANRSKTWQQPNFRDEYQISNSIQCLLFDFVDLIRRIIESYLIRRNIRCHFIGLRSYFPLYF